MEDTTQGVRELVHRIVMSKSIEERFLMCAEMYEDAKEFARVGMPEGMSTPEQEAFIFRRIHGMTPRELVNRG